MQIKYSKQAYKYLTKLHKPKREKLIAAINQLDAVQKQIDAIHAELLTELSDDELTAAERQEIESIRKENDFRTFDEWEKEKPLD